MHKPVTNPAADVLQELLQLIRDNDRAGLEAWNLPANIQMLLQRINAVSGEIRELEAIAGRRAALEQELESLALQLIQKAGLSRPQ